MSINKKLEFGNYTLKFGDQKVLLDCFEEIVMPSFEEMRYLRKLKNKGEYFFLDTQSLILDDNPEQPVIGIVGRIVKNTKLKRDQVFRSESGIIEDKSELETAPSSIFLLILNTHRLVFSREVQGAPTVQNFQSTSQYCLNQRYLEYINEQYEKLKESRNQNSDLKHTTKKSLRITTPKPYLRVTPLSDKESLKDFIDRLVHIDKVSIKLLETNDEEINNDNFWSELGRKNEQMNSKAAKVDFTNAKEGLDNCEVLQQAKSATRLGNSEVKFKGHDSHGGSINGTNEDFNLTIELTELPRDIIKAAKFKYQEFKNLVASGTIMLPIIKSATEKKIKQIFSKFNK